MKPWCRGPPYFLGLLMGIMYREYKTFRLKSLTDSTNYHDYPILEKIKHWT